MGSSISALRDDFEDGLMGSPWTEWILGSATVAETVGQLRLTLPASTAGTHESGYHSVSRYDLTGASIFIDIGTMVATGVAAYASYTLRFVAGFYLRWIQQSGTLKAQYAIDGVLTDLYGVAWNAATYKYLRFSESGGTVTFASSTDGTTWTSRATVTIATLTFPVTDLAVWINAGCGNVAAPGSFRLDDINVLAAPTTAWNWTQIKRELTDRYRTITLAMDTPNTAQAYVVTADGVDVSDNPTGNVRYWSGPADAGRKLTEQASQALAQTTAVLIPTDGRFDLPDIIEARCIRIYHRSMDGAAYRMYEMYPRRLVQTDDLDAEIIRGMTISGHQFITDRLSALTANIGELEIDIGGYIWQGTGTADVPITGLKIFQSGGVGKLSTYNTGVEQVTLDTDGRLKAGAGAVQLDFTGLKFDINLDSGDNTFLRWYWDTTLLTQMYTQLESLSLTDTNITLDAKRIRIDGRLMVGSGLATPTNVGDAAIAGGLNIGGGTGAGVGEIRMAEAGTAKTFVAIDDTAANGDILLALENSGNDIATGSFFIRGRKGTTVQFYARGDGALNTAAHYRVADTQVVSTRKTGWGAATGTAQRGTFATDTVTLINLARAVKALTDDLISHGLIGS